MKSYTFDRRYPHHDCWIVRQGPYSWHECFAHGTDPNELARKEAEHAQRLSGREQNYMPVSMKRGRRRK